MKKAVCLFIVSLIFQHASNAQETKYYGIVEYKISGGNAYISMPMRANKDWGQGGFMQTGYTKFDVIEKGLKREFTKMVLTKYGIAINDGYPNEFDVSERGDFPGILDNKCPQCMWTYDEAMKVRAELINILISRNYGVVAVE